MSSAIIVWAVHFTAIYGFTGLACARGFASAVPWVIGAATLLAATAVLAIIAHGYRRRAAFEAWMSATLGGFALLAIAWEAIPVLVVPACG